jgi:adenosylcobinamide-phosphate synthase
VRSELGRGQLELARHKLRSLCSRDASALDEPSIVAATIESLAENASDSFVAPLFYYMLLGLPGVVFYRAVNTLDAMIGYHGRYEYLGKVAARVDDLLNLIPARLTAALLLAAGALTGKDPLRGLQMLRRDGRNTASPNAGRPMAAMAGLLGVQLEKRGDYSLGDPAVPLAPGSIDEAWRVVTGSAVLTAVLTALTIAARGAYRG